MKKQLLFLFLSALAAFSTAQVNVDSLEKALPSLKDTALINAINALSKEYYRKDLAASKKYADSALKLSNENNFMRGKAEAYSNIAIGSLMRGNNARALSAIDTALQFCEKINNPTVKASLLNVKGVVLFYTGEYKQSLEYFEQSLAIKRRLNDPIEMSKSLSNIGSIYSKIGYHEKALEYYLQAEKIDESRKDSLALASDFLNIGGIYYDKNDFKKAHDYFVKCLDCPGIDNLMKANCLRNLGNVEGLTGDYKKALEYCFRGLELDQQLSNKPGISSSYNNIGTIYEYLKEYDKALDFFNKSLALKMEMGDENAAASTYGNIGLIYYDKGDYEKAKEYVEKGMVISKKYRNMLVIRNGYEKLMLIYSRLKQSDKAIESFNNYRAYNDSILSIETANGLSEMQTKYETEKKEKENQLLASENEIKALELSKERTQRNLIIGLFAVILVLGLILFNRNRLKHRNKLLMEKDLRNRAVFKAHEEEKARLSQELHDGVGPLLSLIKLNVSSLPANPETEKIIHEIKDLTSESMKEVRSISHALMPSLLEKKGLKAALADFVEQINQSGKTKVNMDYAVSGDLTTEVQVNVYRIIQEVLNNMMKHANASGATVSLNERGGQLEIKVSDNGKGFESDILTNGNGMNNIYSRVDFLKGELKVNTAPGKGTEFHIFIPLKAEVYA